MNNISRKIKENMNNVWDFMGWKSNEVYEHIMFQTFLGNYNIEDLRKVLSANGFFESLKEVIGDRTLRKYNVIGHYLEGDNILDVGAGDGELADYIYQKTNKNITLVDVIDINKTHLPLHVYDGETLPFRDNQFDTSMAYVVYHHCESPFYTFNESTRVAKRHATVEAVSENAEEFEINMFFDWFFNRIMLESDGMNIPFNYKPSKEWRDHFKYNNLKLIEFKDLGMQHLPLLPEHRYLMVIEK